MHNKYYRMIGDFEEIEEDDDLMGESNHYNP